MDNLIRALIRVLVTAGFFMILPLFPFLGINFQGGILEALALAGVFELTLWALVFVYGGSAVALGYRPQDLPVALNLGVFLAQSTAFVALAGLFAPSLLAVSGFFGSLTGGLALLAISAVIMTRARGCAGGCGPEKNAETCASCPNKGNCGGCKNCGN